MSYLDEAGLARYDGLLKGLALRTGADYSLLNWQKTSAAGAVSFSPVPEMPIDPVVNFMFTETGPASGTKGPDNPSTITGVSSITVTRCETAGVDETQYTVNLGGTFYGGSVDLSAGTMTVTVGVTVLDENYNFGTTSGYLTEYTNFYAIVFYPGFGPYRTGYNIPSTFSSNRLPIEYKDSQGVPTQNSLLLGSVSRGMKLCLSKTDLSLGDNETITTVRAAMLQWLSTHPITITCPLEISTIVQLTPTQIYSLSQFDPYNPRINTVYSDQTSVQVGYPKSPQATQNELTSAIVSLGGNV